MIDGKGEYGLILEGGASRGVFTAGALDFLMEQDFYFPYIAGVSAGACNAVDYAAKQHGRTKNCMIVNERKYNYVNLHAIVREHSLFDMDMIFDTFPNEIFPFDYDTYFKSDIRCDLVVTNAMTGKAEYKNERHDPKRLMQICRASSSIPLFSPMVTLDHMEYVDGGIADSIPIARSLKKGNRKNVIILTRNLGYRKSEPKSSRAIYAAALKKYPYLLHTILHRYEFYNRQVAAVEKWEKEGRVFVIRPEIPPVKRAEKNYETLLAFYDHGYEIMRENFVRMKEFLGC